MLASVGAAAKLRLSRGFASAGRQLQGETAMERRRGRDPDADARGSKVRRRVRWSGPSVRVFSESAH